MEHVPCGGEHEDTSTTHDQPTTTPIWIQDSITQEEPIIQEQHHDSTQEQNHHQVQEQEQDRHQVEEQEHTPSDDDVP